MSRKLKDFSWDDPSNVAFFDGKSVFVTGGTGSLGKALTQLLLTKYNVRSVVIFSRDEFKQSEMKRDLGALRSKVMFRIGDVRDFARLKECMEGCEYVIHAAALKHVDIAELNPTEAIKTNILGAIHVIDAAKACGVTHVVALSTDKACNPVNLYGATKLCSDSLFVAGNAQQPNLRMSVVRYGNVFTSRGSVVPFFTDLKKKKVASLPVTHEQMTRFNISLPEACNMVLRAFVWMTGGEMFVPKIPSYRIVDVVKAFDLPHHIIGIRPGEKLHEVMIPEDVSHLVYEFSDHFAIVPSFDWYMGSQQLENNGGKKVQQSFSYSSGDNTFLTVDELKVLLQQYEAEL